MISGAQLRRHSYSIDCSRPILTEQQHKEVTNINNIMEMYVKTGQLPGLTGTQLMYVDDTNKLSFEETHNVITHAQKLFSQLPTKLKNELNNDYRKLEAWLSDPDNREQATKYGLIIPHKPENKPDKVEPATTKSANTPQQNEPKGE